MIGSSWECVAEQILIKLWKKLWSNICETLEKNSVSLDEEHFSDELQPLDFLEVFMQIDGCSGINVNDINNWFDTDNNGDYTTTTEEKIIVPCPSNKVTDNKNDDKEDEQPEAVMMTHLETTTSMNKFISYVECQSDTTLGELLMKKPMRDRAAHKLLWCTRLTQKKVTQYFTSQ